jgi:hypothetical protein
VPIGSQHEKGAAVMPAEGAGESGVFERNSIEHLSAVGHP